MAEVSADLGFAYQHFGKLGDEDQVSSKAKELFASLSPPTTTTTTTTSSSSDSNSAGTEGLKAEHVAESVYELLRLAVEDRINAESAVAVLQSTLVPATAEAAAAAAATDGGEEKKEEANRIRRERVNILRNHVATAIWLLGVEAEAQVPPDQRSKSSHWIRLLEVIKAALTCAPIPMLDRDLALRTFSKALLAEPVIRIFGHEKLPNTVVKANTKIRYTQKTFNLLREESEGYAKLAALLSQVSRATVVADATNRIMALIGNFLLSPSRALDIVLEAFEAYFGIAGAFSLVALPVGFNYLYCHYWHGCLSDFGSLHSHSPDTIPCALSVGTPSNLACSFLLNWQRYFLKTKFTLEF